MERPQDDPRRRRPKPSTVHGWLCKMRGTIIGNERMRQQGRREMQEARAARTSSKRPRPKATQSKPILSFLIGGGGGKPPARSRQKQKQKMRPLSSLFHLDPVDQTIDADAKKVLMMMKLRQGLLNCLHLIADHPSSYPSTLAGDDYDDFDDDEAVDEKEGADDCLTSSGC